MKKILGILTVFVLGFMVVSQTNQVYAAPCTAFNLVGSSEGSFNEGVPSNKISLKITNIADGEYVLTFRGQLDNYGTESIPIFATASGGVLNFTSSDQTLFQAGNWEVYVSQNTWFSSSCDLYTYKVVGPHCGPVYVSQTGRNDSTAAGVCFYNTEGGCLDSTHDVHITSTVLKGDNSPYTKNVVHSIWLVGRNSGSSSNGIFVSSFGALEPTNYQVEIKTGDLDGGKVLCTYDFEIKSSCNDGAGTDQCSESVQLIPSGPDVFSLCNQIPEDKAAQVKACLDCAGGEEGTEGVWTAIGCIKKDPQVIITKLINVGLGIGGGVALITFLAAGFIFSTSQGSPERVKNAKEMMTASIIGLVFVIFSVTLLQFIGWSVLKIPGFGG